MRKRFITLAVLLLSCGLVWPAGVPSEGLGIDIITVVIHTVREPGTLALIGIGLAVGARKMGEALFERMNGA